DTTNFTFYCNSANTGTEIIFPNDGKFDGTHADSKSISCTYSAGDGGDRWPKVIVERSEGAVQDRKKITISATSYTGGNDPGGEVCTTGPGFVGNLNVPYHKAAYYSGTAHHSYFTAHIGESDIAS